MIEDWFKQKYRARAAEVDAGFAAGADDYVIKPFSPRELVARINSLFRRQSHRAAVDVANADERQRAAEVQQNLLPRQKLTLDGFDLAGRFRPSRSVGGDFYDWYPTPDGLKGTLRATLPLW